MHRLTLLPLLLMASPLALADDNGCPHSAPRQLSLDTAGAKVVRVETHQHTVRLRAAPGSSHVLSGRACAGKAAWLQDLTVTQAREGDTLVVRLLRENPAGLASLFGDNRASLERARRGHRQGRLRRGGGPGRRRAQGAVDRLG